MPEVEELSASRIARLEAFPIGGTGRRHLVLTGL